MKTQQLLADNEAKKKEILLCAKALYMNDIIDVWQLEKIYGNIFDKYNSIEKTIKNANQ